MKSKPRLFLITWISASSSDALQCFLTLLFYSPLDLRSSSIRSIASLRFKPAPSNVLLILTKSEIIPSRAFQSSICFSTNFMTNQIWLFYSYNLLSLDLLLVTSYCKDVILLLPSYSIDVNLSSSFAAMRGSSILRLFTRISLLLSFFIFGSLLSQSGVLGSFDLSVAEPVASMVPYQLTTRFILKFTLGAILSLFYRSDASSL